MRLSLAGLLVCAALASAGCAPSLIRGTEIRDTSETRAILDVIGNYRASLEGRNVEGVMKLVGKTFFENSGTPEGSDDYDYAGLEAKLKIWAEKTKTVRAILEVKQIFIEGDTARVRFFFDVNYQITVSPAPEAAPQWKRETDTKEMTLKREGGTWRIVSGI